MIKKWLQPSHSRFHLTQTSTGMAAYEVEISGERVMKKPEEISAEVLKYLVKYAKEYLAEDVKEAVISVPAYFSGAQRKATMTAAELAGLKVSRLISEPVAGALHYVSDKQIKAKILVFDFGGGTLDVSLIEVKDQSFEVKAVAGDTMLGGRNIDEKLFKHFYVPATNNIDKNVLRSIRRLEQGCISMKEYLTINNEFTKVIDCYDGDFDLELTLDRKKFEELNQDIFQKTIDIVNHCLTNANWKKEDIQQVILVGGSTRIPKMRSLLQELFGASKIKTDLNPDEAVAAGACLQAAILSKGYPSLEKYKIREVTSLSLGLSGYGNLTTFVIPKNSRLPAFGSLNRVTVYNNQKRVAFHISEGERKNSEYNNELGSFTISDLPRKKAGDVTFTVKFSLDEDGILTVSATEKSTGKNNSLTVTMGEFRLSEHQISYSIEDSVRQKEEDDLFEKFILKRNSLIEQCNGWEYKNNDDEICEKCKNFIEYAESLTFESLELLNHAFSELEDEILGKASTLDVSDKV